MIEVNSVSLRYGPQILFDGISCNISTSDKIALAGRNGAGKTTFLKILLGQSELDEGSISVGNRMSVGYLPQDGIEGEGKLLIEEVESAETSIGDLQSQLDACYTAVEGVSENEADDHGHELWDAIHRIEDELRLRESHKLRSKAEKMLFGLGFKKEDLERNTQEFSGGWQMRIALAKLLLQNPDYLLLDEPTNHLDLPSQRWLENFLKSYRGGLVLISHDKAFLDQLTQKTYSLSRGRLEVYAGNYSYFIEQSRLRKEQLAAQKESQDRQIEQTKKFIDRFRAKASKATQVQSRIKQLEKVEIIEIESDENSVFFRFPPAPRSSQIMVSIEGISKAFGRIELFENFDLKIEREQRLAVVGANGAGKSTLAKMIAGELDVDEGIIDVNEKTVLSYFAQHQTAQLDVQHNVLQAAMSSGCTNEQTARDVLGSFLFSGDAVFKKVGVLSGGEKNRLALARMLLKPANFLILDEPTNHLDIQSKAILQEALKAYDGAFLIISHDRDFLDPIVQKTLEISPDGHRIFWCNVSEYLAKTEEEALHAKLQQGQTQSDGIESKSAMNPKVLRKLRVERQQKLKPLKDAVEKWENRSMQLEEEIGEWEIKMADPEFFSARPEQKDDLIAYEKAKEDLDEAMLNWERAQDAIGVFEANNPEI